MTWVVVYNTSSRTYRLRGIDGGTILGLSYGAADDTNPTIRRGLDAGFLRIDYEGDTYEARVAQKRARELNLGLDEPTDVPVHDLALIERMEKLEQEWMGIEKIKGDPGPAGPAGPPGISAIMPVVYSQSVASKVWEWAHTFPYRPDVEVFDSSGNELEADVSHPPGKVRVEFGFPMTGSIRLF